MTKRDATQMNAPPAGPHSHPTSLPPPPPASRWYRWSVYFLLVAGTVAGEVAWNYFPMGPVERTYGGWLVVGALVLAVLPSVKRGVDWFWVRFEQPKMRTRLIVAAVLSILSSLIFLWSAVVQNTPLRPAWHDEFSYLLQMHMLAQGRLWMPAHPCAEFFDTFYVMVRPVYASIYFPGTALTLAPAIWLHLPYAAGPLAVSGLCVGMMYLVCAELFDGATALLGAPLVWAFSPFRMVSVMVLSQAPALLLGLTMVFACQRWRVNKRRGWLIALGAAAGWAAITRPLDAVCFALPVGIALAMDLWKSPTRTWGATAVCIVAGALPFLGLQLIFDRALTGQWLETPFQQYTEINYPGAQYGFHEPPATPPHVSNVPEKQIFYDVTVIPRDLRPHRWENVAPLFWDRLKGTLWQLLPNPMLWVLAPLVLVGLGRKRWMVWASLPLFFILSMGYAFYLKQYLVAMLPGVVVTVLAPVDVLARTFPSRRGFLRTFLGLSILLLCMAAMPECDGSLNDRGDPYLQLRQIDQTLASAVHAPAVVLFHYDVPADGKLAGNISSPEQEPVFNSQTAWPDDAPIIRAQDLNVDLTKVGHIGDADRALYEYYFQHDPSRVFYLYERNPHGDQLTFLGTGAELVQLTKPSGVHP